MAFGTRQNRSWLWLRRRQRRRRRRRRQWWWWLWWRCDVHDNGKTFRKMKITLSHIHTTSVRAIRLQHFSPIIYTRPFVFAGLCGAGWAYWHTIREKDTEAVRSSSNLLSGKSGTFNVKNNTVNVIIVIYSCRMNGRRSLTHWLWITLLFRKDNGVYTAQSFTREYLSFLLTSAFFLCYTSQQSVVSFHLHYWTMSRWCDDLEWHAMLDVRLHHRRTHSPTHKCICLVRAVLTRRLWTFWTSLPSECVQIAMASYPPRSAATGENREKKNYPKYWSG